MGALRLIAVGAPSPPAVLLPRLSLRYHLHRKTGEVLRVIDRGTTSIQDLLTSVLFNILPALLDIGIGVVYFAVLIALFPAPCQRFSNDGRPRADVGLRACSRSTDCV